MIWFSGLLFLVATAVAGSIPVKAYLPAEQEPELERTFVEGPGSRIVNGVPSELFSRPYQASLQVFYRNAWYHNCGAVIIARDLLVTAAHCLMSFPPNLMRLEVGSMDLKAPVLKYTQFLNISAVKLHEDFLIDESVGYPNDIGLIFLSTPITYNDNVQPIKIAPPGLSFDNEICVISGWGRIYGGGPVSPVLLQANMRKWTYEQCYAVNKESNMIINRNHVCVKGESDDGHAPGGCNGDSGGPLTCKHKNKLYLLGVTSYGWDPCDTNYPTVYTRVPGYINWINKYKNLFDSQTENH
ncbi:trypsin [Biomphalaria glabrata]|nr:trypsin [Biomphalaria glabrata]